MKRTLGLAAALLLVLPEAGSGADEPRAREIMQRVEDRDDGDRQTMKLEMTLIDKSGRKRVRRLQSFARDVGEDNQSLLFFESPADVKDTGFLTHDYDDGNRDDDQWLYLPALRKTKRIASSDKSGSFMGSDFSFADMTSRNLEAYDYRVMKETEHDGAPVWQIESIPRTEDEIDRTGYTRSISFVRKDNFVVVRAVSWVQKGGRLKYMDVKKLEKIDGIWVATEVHMTTKKGKKTLHKTVLRSLDVKFDQGLEASLFTPRRLEKGL